MLVLLSVHLLFTMLLCVGTFQGDKFWDCECGHLEQDQGHCYQK